MKINDDTLHKLIVIKIKSMRDVSSKTYLFLANFEVQFLPATCKHTIANTHQPNPLDADSRRFFEFLV